MRKFDIECRLIIDYDFDTIYNKEFAQVVRAKNILKEVKPMEKRVAKAGFEDLFDLINSKIANIEEEVRKQIEEKTLKLRLLLDEVSDVVVEKEITEEKIAEDETAEDETSEDETTEEVVNE